MLDFQEAKHITMAMRASSIVVNMSVDNLIRALLNLSDKNLNELNSISSFTRLTKMDGGICTLWIFLKS
jgi:hypothetical protein